MQALRFSLDGEYFKYGALHRMTYRSYDFSVQLFLLRFQIYIIDTEISSRKKDYVKMIRKMD